MRPNELRTCIYKNDTFAYFHRWCDYAYTTGASLLVGGASAGQIATVFALIELEDGTILRAEPENIQFDDVGFPIAEKIIAAVEERHEK